MARFTLPRALRSPFVIGSGVIHVVFVAALVLVPSLRSGPRFPDAFAVELVGSAGPAVPAVEQVRPQPPAPEPSTPPPVKPPDEGVRVEPVEPKITKKKREPEEEVVAEPAPPDPAPSGPEADFSPDEAATGMGDDGGEVGGGLGGGDLGDSELAWYQSSVTAALYSRWQRPILSGMRETLEVAVEFEILRDGRVQDLRVTGPSGVPSLDRSALRAVSDAAPLPPVPSSWRGNRVPARFVFILHSEEL